MIRKLFFRDMIVSLLIGFTTTVSGQNVFVSPGGDDGNPGIKERPKRTIQAALENMTAGDTLFLRGGIYEEEVVLDHMQGAAGRPLVFMAYDSEVPIIDGTSDLKEIKKREEKWTLATDHFPDTRNIYKIKVEKDIWQLWLKDPLLMNRQNAAGGQRADFRMQVVARWPDGKTNPCDPLMRIPDSTAAAPNTWWSFTTTWAFASDPKTDHKHIVNSPVRFDLAGTGKSFKGGTAIISAIRQGPANIPVQILEHNAGSDMFVHSGIDENYELYKYPSDFGPSYIIQHLDALDSPGEWYYDRNSKTVYLWPEDNKDPNLLEVRGKTKTYAFDIRDGKYIEFNGLSLFGSSLKISGEHISFVNGAISYPDMPKTLLGKYGIDLPAVDARKCDYFIMRNCVAEYSQYHFIETGRTGSVFENNYFHHLAMLGLGSSGCFLNVNTFLYNTLETIGSRAAVKTNSDPKSGRIQSWNLLDGWGFLYANDGVGFQSNQDGSVHSVRAYTWFIRSNKPGHRYDGPDEGKGFPTLGLSHHLVGYRSESVSTTIKGDYNEVYNYLGILSTSRHGDIAIRYNINTGEGNKHTIMRNCAADRINIGKWDPLSCIHSNNWDASKQGGSMTEFIPSAELLDFRPAEGSPLIDAGYHVPGVTDGYLGSAPDIGAYEWGNDVYWIPGFRDKKITMPIPYDGTKNISPDQDLMFRNAYQCENAILYFGLERAALENASISSSKSPGNANLENGDVIMVKLKEGKNIVTPTMIFGNPNNFDPTPYLLVDDPKIKFAAGKTYFWRVDALNACGKFSKGSVWSFSTGGVN